MLLAVGATAQPAAATSPGADALVPMLDGTCDVFSGDTSVIVADPQTGFHYSRSSDRVFPSASLYKLGVMVEAYRLAASGALSLDDTTVTIEDSDLTDDGYVTGVGTTLTVREAIERMITISDNSPARALLRIEDAHNVNATMSRLGLASTRINVDLPEEEQVVPFNTTTARDMERFFVGLLRGAVVGRQQSADMLGVLRRQQINDRLPAGLPEGTEIAHKTGNLPGFAHDAGVIYTRTGPRVVVVLTSDYDQYDDVITLNERIGALTYAAKLDGFAARYRTVEPPATVIRTNDLMRWTVQVTNASDVAWTSGTYLRQTMRSGTSTSTTGLGQIKLPPLVPGASTVLTVNVMAPAVPGPYVLELEVIDEALGSSGNRFPLVFNIHAN
jgi:beta-lactamase class A